MLAFDTRKAVKELEEAGMERPVAKATVEMTISSVDKHAATKADLATKTDVAETNESIDAARDEFHKNISETNESMAETNERMIVGFDKLNERASKTNSKIDANRAELYNLIFETKTEISLAKVEIIKWLVSTTLWVAAWVILMVIIIRL